jgi:predicted dehydrogenase
LDAWARIPEVRITACCDLDPDRAAAASRRFGIPRHYTDFRCMLDAERPDFVDVITRVDSHAEICQEAAGRGIHIICQKPLARTLAEAQAIAELESRASIRFMVHENFRFQPWYRETKRLLEQGRIGPRLHSLTFRTRLGDGWGDSAYLSRQTYFRDMPHFLVFETGIHFIDTFRFLAGEVQRVYSVLRRLNPVIAGEDCCLLTIEFQSGAVGVWDGNRYNESNHDDPRYTFGEMLVEGSGGSIRLRMDGMLTIQPLGEPERPHPYHHPRRGFAGDCCHATQQHFVQGLLAGQPFETSVQEYLRSLRVQEAVYESAAQHAPVAVQDE